MSFSDKVYDKLDEMFQRLEPDSIQNCSNIDIIENNRLVELRHEFEKKGINPDESELFFTISNAFSIIITTATVKFDYYIHITKLLLDMEINSSFFSLLFNKKLMEKREELKKKKRKIHELYENDANYIFKFDVGKNINELLDKTKNFSQQNIILPKYMEDIVNPLNPSEERFIHNCNIDLKKLGYDVKIPSQTNDSSDNKKETLFKYDRNFAEKLYRLINCVELALNDFPITRKVVTQSIKEQLKESIPAIIYSKKYNYDEDYQELYKITMNLCNPKYIALALNEYNEQYLSETNDDGLLNAFKEELESINFEDLDIGTLKKAKRKKYKENQQ